tara:strand:+ start:4215 stop:5153 length:939 start_codon:yes stop_codon:yes gene_type:complete
MLLEKSGRTTDSYKLQQPEHIVSLATSSMLVSVDVNVWTATKQDRGISDEVTTMKKAELGTGKFTKYLFAKNPKHHRIVKLRQLILKWLRQSTYRWNNSQHLLPTVDLEKFKTEYDKYESEFNTAVEDFLENYQTLVSDEAFKQGDMFDKSDYPSVEELRHKFNMRLFVAEVPSQDFRCQVSQDTADDLKAEYQQQADDIVRTVINDQCNRIVDVMRSISHCCGMIEGVDKEGQPTFKKRAIYDTTFQRAKALVNTIKNFKPIDNEQSDMLQEAVDDLEKVIGGVSTDLLRDSDSTRAEVKQGIDDILSKFN